jgi:hypothetical protein
VARGRLRYRCAYMASLPIPTGGCGSYPFSPSTASKEGWSCCAFQLGMDRPSSIPRPRFHAPLGPKEQSMGLGETLRGLRDSRVLLLRGQIPSDWISVRSCLFGARPRRRLFEPKVKPR